MGESLLSFEVTDEVAASALVESAVGEREGGGCEIGGDVGGRGLLSDDEDLSMRGCGEEGDEEA
jgi:hypothetical protein